MSSIYDSDEEDDDLHDGPLFPFKELGKIVKRPFEYEKYDIMHKSLTNLKDRFGSRCINILRDDHNQYDAQLAVQFTNTMQMRGFIELHMHGRDNKGAYVNLMSIGFYTILAEDALTGDEPAHRFATWDDCARAVAKFLAPPVPV